MHEDPAGCAVDSNEKVAAGGLVRDLRQVFDVDVEEARIAVLEGLLGLDGFAFSLWDHVFKAGPNRPVFRGGRFVCVWPAADRSRYYEQRAQRRGRWSRAVGKNEVMPVLAGSRIDDLAMVL